MKKVLLPVDGTPRSMKAAELVKTIYDPDECEIYVLNVRRGYEDKIDGDYDYDKVKQAGMGALNQAADILEGYNIEKEIIVGRNAAEIILDYAEDIAADAIVMTKSTKTIVKRVLGSVTEQVVKNASCIVIIVPEKDF